MSHRLGGPSTHGNGRGERGGSGMRVPVTGTVNFRECWGSMHHGSAFISQESSRAELAVGARTGGRALTERREGGRCLGVR